MGRTVQDVVVRALCRRRGWVDEAGLSASSAEAVRSRAPLAQVLVRDRRLPPERVAALLGDAARATLACGRCLRRWGPGKVALDASPSCPECEGELELALDPPAAGPATATTTPAEPVPSSTRLRGALTRGPDGLRFGPYRIERELGRGGMGVVYEARRVEPGTGPDSAPAALPPAGGVVALKVLLAGEHASRTQRTRFQREAELTARLEHPGIVAIHDVGEVEGFPYFTMERVEGAPLDELFDAATPERPLDPLRLARLVRDVARALGHAHAQGAVHRDVKPANVLVRPDDTPVVTDFGLALDLERGEADRLTRSGALVGTPFYMSPEQVRGRREDVGPASDVWALGVILYQGLTGTLPFRAESQHDLNELILRHDPPPPRALAPGVPPALEAVALRALERDPQRRYPDGAALAQDLDRALAGALTEAPTLGLAERARRHWARHRRLDLGLAAGGLVAAAVTAGAGAGLLAAQRRRLAEVERAAAREAEATAAGARARRAQEAEAARRARVAAVAEATRAAEQAPPGPAYRAALEALIARLDEALAAGPTRASEATPDPAGPDAAGADAAGQRAALRLARARALARADRLGEARADLARLATEGPPAPLAAEAAYLAARWAAADGRPSQAGRERARAALETARPSPGADAGAWGLLLDAAAAFLAQDLDAAAALCARARAAAPGLVEGHGLAARVHATAGRAAEAAKAVEQALALDPKDPDLWALAARVHAATDGPRRALSDLDRALELAPVHEDALELRAMLLRAVGRYGEALRDARALLERRGDERELQLVIAQLLELDGRLDQADALLERLIAADPDDPAPWRLRARRALQAHDLDRALETLRRGLEAAGASAAGRPTDAAPGRRALRAALVRLAHATRRPAPLRAHALALEARAAARPAPAERAALAAEAELLRAEAAFVEGDGPAGFAALERALALAPDDLPARRLRLEATLARRPAAEHAPALAEFERWAGERPDALAALARTLVVADGDLARAEALARAALARDADQAEAHAVLGFTAGAAGRDDEADRALQRAIELDEHGVDAPALLGTRRLAQGDGAEAELLLARAYELDPFRDDVVQALLVLLVRTQRAREAVAIGRRQLELQRAAGRTPDGALVVTFAQSLAAAGRPEAAATLLEELLAGRPPEGESFDDDAASRADARVVLASIYAATQRTAEAKALVERVLATRPDHPQARALRERLR